MIFKSRVVDVAQLNLLVPAKIIRNRRVAKVVISQVIVHCRIIFSEHRRNFLLALHGVNHCATLFRCVVRQILHGVGKILKPLKIFLKIQRRNIFDGGFSQRVKFLKSFLVNVKQRKK